MSDRVTTAEAVEALRALNSAIWRAHPKWASFSPETAKASEVIANWEWAETVRTVDLAACHARWGKGCTRTYDLDGNLTGLIDGNARPVEEADWPDFLAYQAAEHER